MWFVRLMVMAPVVGLALTGCIFGGDSDGDGLSNKEEKDLGLDPDSTDSDGDGLDDALELEIGSDPLSEDSDGDTYLDLWEVNEGTDPADEDDRIYTGYWPYNPDKESVEDPGYNGPLSVGDFVWSFSGKDQFGEKVDLFDFLGQGKDVIVDASAEWCGPCQITSLWLSSGGEIDYFGYEADFKKLRNAIDNGDVYWVTVIVQNNAGGASTVTTVKNWDESYPHELIPVITDKGDMLEGTIGTTGFFPTGMLLDENGEVLVIGGMDDAMDEAQKRL